MTFEWDEAKNEINIKKHEIDFYMAQYAFGDPKRVIRKDVRHSSELETRYFCFGMVDDKVATVRFTMRDNHIRIFGAGYWREGKKVYEKENNL